jgi:type IV pilus assembly protein PilM
MPSGNAVWGIDIGQTALKALKLRAAGDGKVEAVAFDVIEHAKILSQPDADRDELIVSALEKFASRNEWQGDQFVVGVPGQQTFARFCKMPPIDIKKDAKKIPDLVKYEASQQIPFDIDDVIWDYQIFTKEGSPDIEVGIFAIRKDLIRKHLGYFATVGIAPAAVQTIPAALYNFCEFDGQRVGDGGATVIVDVGAQNTDLVIAEESAAWTRNIPLGGNSFTEALVRSFKLSFAKAESLKRTASDSKYARQIFQAMRPIFADLVAEIQRSIGFYSSTHRDVELRRVVAIGNAFRLPGLQRYLENNLTISGGVVKLETFKNLVPNATTNAPQFTDNVLSFGAAYGLAVQGLGLGKIRATLLPTELARIAVWQKKRPFFIATAASLAAAACIPFIGNYMGRQALAADNSETDRKIQAAITEAERFQTDFNQTQTNTTERQADIEKLIKLREQRLTVPKVLALVEKALPPVNPAQADLATVTSVAEFKKKIEGDPKKYARTERNQFIIESLKIEYAPDVMTADLSSAAAAAAAAAAANAGAAGPMGGPGMGPMGPMMPGGRGMMPGMPGRGRMPGMGGMGMGGPGVAPPPTPTGGAGGAEGGGEAAATNPGFVVRVQGRLLKGVYHEDAIKWFQDYAARLRDGANQPKRGFHIPPDKDAQTPSISMPAPMKLAATVAAPADGGGKTGVQVPDPVTGEETKDDWQLSFAFRIKLGDAAAPEGGADPNAPAPPSGPVRGPGMPGPGRMPPPQGRE